MQFLSYSLVDDWVMPKSVPVWPPIRIITRIYLIICILWQTKCFDDQSSQYYLFHFGKTILSFWKEFIANSP